MKKSILSIAIAAVLLSSVPSFSVYSSAVKTKVTTYNLKSKSSSALLLDWWTSASKIFYIGATAKITDIATKKTFWVKRTTGTNHADSEALTVKDTNIIKSIWKGFSWARRPIIVTINGKNIAASMSGMPHAGVDKAPALSYVKNRSCGYGSGENLDFIKGNGMNGHFDIHFLHSTRHKDGKQDSQHQYAVMEAAHFRLSMK